jgi:hypothetical protein
VIDPLIVAHWIVPTVQQAPGTYSGWEYSSQWVGLGGVNDGFLLQAGSAANVFCDVGNNIPEYFPWIEWLPQSEIVLYKNATTKTPYPFVPGDYITVTITATNFSSGGSTTGTLSFVDSTQHWSIALSFTAASLAAQRSPGSRRNGSWSEPRWMTL